MFTWLLLPNLPQVPEHFVHALKNTEPKGHDSTKDLISPEARQHYRDRTIVVDGAEKPTRYYQGYPLGEEWEQWVKDNIIEKFFDTGGRVSYPNSDIHGAHVDRSMTNPPSIKWKINYFVETGGDNVTTSWYKQYGYPVVRTAEMPQNVTDYRSLELIDRTIIPANTWVILNTQIMHGVENLGQTPRRHFTILVDPEDVRFGLLQ